MTEITPEEQKKYEDYYNIVKICRESKDYDNAIAHYNGIIDMYKDNPDVYYNRGSLYNCKGDHESAIADYSMAIKLDPDDADTYNVRGIQYFLINDYDRAISDFSIAMMRLPPNKKKALMHFPDGRLDHPYLIRLYFNRSFVYKIIGEIEKSIMDKNVINIFRKKPVFYRTNRFDTNTILKFNLF